VPETLEGWVREFGKQASSASLFVSQKREIDSYPELVPYAHYLRQAWAELDLTAVLCVDGRPTVYLCEGKRFSAEKKRQIHRFVWNQALVPLVILGTPNAIEVHSAVRFPEREHSDDGLFETSSSSLILQLTRIAETLELSNFVRSIETGQFFQDHAVC
jgi:hypothetical protein